MSPSGNPMWRGSLYELESNEIRGRSGYIMAVRDHDFLAEPFSLSRLHLKRRRDIAQPSVR